MGWEGAHMSISPETIESHLEALGYIYAWSFLGGFAGIRSSFV